MVFVWSLVLLVHFIFLHSLFSFTFTTCFPLIQPKCHEYESHALLQFKQGFVINKSASLFPSYPKTEIWNPSKDCCSWDGIKCDVHTNHVIHMNLSSSQLYGTLDANSSLFHLVHLRVLDLSDNHFNYSQISPRIGELSQLSYLDLSYNFFSGEIPPQISQLSKLLSLYLSYNYKHDPKGSLINLLQLKLSSLKSIIQNSTKLETLVLDYVTISSILPYTLTNLTSLQKLSLQNSELYGEFSIGVFHLPNLKYLDLSNNENLNGRFPEFQSSSLSKLDLDNTGFNGTLPISIGNLSSLNSLTISNCHFSGYIPSSLGNLTQLMLLYLEENKFKGDPSTSLENLTKVRFLNVGYNEFNFETITWIGKLSSIRSLDMSNVNIGSPIPLSLANLTQLELFFAANSSLIGEIPSFIMNLTNLVFLNIESNLLHGKLKLDKFLKLKNLALLFLSNNKLSLINGKISFNVTDSQIELLAFASCNLVVIPPFIEDLGALVSLDLQNNNITSLPSWLWSKTNLQRLFVSENSLIGEISSSICNLKSLIFLDLSFNNLTGNVPSCLGNFSQSLQLLMLNGNKLSGLIPHTYMIGNNLQMIDFRNNNLQGQLPRALINCRWLEYFDISHNNIKDSFPFWLGDLPELKVLALSNNDFYGDIRCSESMTCTFSKLHIINLSNNKFSGSFPSELIQRLKAMKTSNTSQLQYMQWNIRVNLPKNGGYYTVTIPYSLTIINKGHVLNYKKLQKSFYKMIAIDISSNKISGEIPKVIGDLKDLVLLNLSNNLLYGSIPSSLGKLSNLEALDLSLNSLSGKIPQQLTQLNFLEFFNVSFNNLSGPIPENTQFSTFQGDSFEGNKGLCGDQLFEFDMKIVLIGYGGGLVAGVALGITFYPQVLGWLKRFF